MTSWMASNARDLYISSRRPHSLSNVHMAGMHLRLFHPQWLKLIFYQTLDDTTCFLGCSQSTWQKSESGVDKVSIGVNELGHRIRPYTKSSNSTSIDTRFGLSTNDKFSADRSRCKMTWISVQLIRKFEWYISILDIGQQVCDFRTNPQYFSTMVSINNAPTVCNGGIDHWIVLHHRTNVNYQVT